MENKLELLQEQFDVATKEATRAANFAAGLAYRLFLMEPALKAFKELSASPRIEERFVDFFKRTQVESALIHEARQALGASRDSLNAVRTSAKALNVLAKLML